jgi:hypothetical protein
MEIRDKHPGSATLGNIYNNILWGGEIALLTTSDRSSSGHKNLKTDTI